MANRTYIVLTDTCTIYPSAIEPDFLPEKQTAAQGIYCLPLLWVAMFRIDDLKAQQFEMEGERVDLKAPLARTQKALAQLEAAQEILQTMFADQTSVMDYCALLREAVTGVQREWITIELDEVASMGDPDTFFAYLELALRALGGEVPHGVGRTALLRLAELEPATRFPEIQLLMEQSRATNEESLTVSQILGCSWLRPVPWE
ncbi:MAG: hypothetical protein WD872_12065 [Pirellulaceae bacterium]